MTHNPLSCPSCHSILSTVADTRLEAVGQHRRRRCLTCGDLYHTLEFTVSQETLDDLRDQRRKERDVEV